MVKSANCWRVWPSAKTTFWISLLASSAVAKVSPQALARSQDSKVLPLERQDAAFNGAPKEAPNGVISGAGIKESKPRVAELLANSVPRETLTTTEVSSGNQGTQERAETTRTQQAIAQSLTTADVLSLDELQQGVVPIGDFTLGQGVDDANVPLERVSSVSELSDVRPTDWAYTAVRNLAERYDCLRAYPDGTYGGNRAMTRYEFAVGLDACMNSMQTLIEASALEISADDLGQMRRLQEEFATELTALRARVDGLEVRAAELEANQFSATSQLSGLAWFTGNAIFANDEIKRETGNRVVAGVKDRETAFSDTPEPVLGSLVWLTFNTSFTGKDSLVVQMAGGNADPPANEIASQGILFGLGGNFTNQIAAGPPLQNQFVLREAFYRFPVGNKLQVVVGPSINWYRYFDTNVFTISFLNGASSFNSGDSTLTNTIDRGAGAVVLFDINKELKLNLAYLGENIEYAPGPPWSTATDLTKGLFGGTNTITAGLTYSPNNRLNLRFLYNRSNIQGIRGFPGNRDGVRQIVGPTTEPLWGVADDGFGGDVGNATADTVVFNFDWLIADKFGIFGRYSYGSTNIEPKNEDLSNGEVNIQAFQFGLAFPDLGTRGALATLSFVVPFDILDGERFLVSGSGDGASQYEIEANYFLPLNRNIAIVPSLYVVGNPNNFSENPTIFVTNLRTQFSF